MRFSSSTSAFRIVLIAACVVAPLLTLDHHLYGTAGFTRWFGENTHEGQDLSKVRRAQAFAREADVLVFGGSFVRYGVSTKPFIDNEIIAWNFGLSGGGPISSYFALKSIAPILAAREKKPVIVLEAFADAMASKVRHWAELVHLNGLARSRAELLRHSGLLAQNAWELGVLPELLMQTILPSTAYRPYMPQLLTHGLSGYWWAADDQFGYVPMQGVAPPPTTALWQFRMSEVQPSRLAFLHAFLDLAKASGVSVVLMSSPQQAQLLSSEERYEDLFLALKARHPGLTFVPMAAFKLAAAEDFIDDGWGHPNVRGADKVSSALIANLGLRRDPHFKEKFGQLFGEIAVPSTSAWQGTFVARPDLGPTSIEYDLPQGGTVIATFSLGPVAAGMEILVEAEIGSVRGAVDICVMDGDRSYCAPTTSRDEARRLDRTRVYSRLRSSGGNVTVRLSVHPWDSRTPTSGRIERLRIVTDKAGRTH